MSDYITEILGRDPTYGGAVNAAGLTSKLGINPAQIAAKQAAEEAAKTGAAKFGLGNLLQGLGPAYSFYSVLDSLGFFDNSMEATPMTPEEAAEFEATSRLALAQSGMQEGGEGAYETLMDAVGQAAQTGLLSNEDIGVSGKWYDPETGEVLPDFNPNTGEGMGTLFPTFYPDSVADPGGGDTAASSEAGSSGLEAVKSAAGGAKDYVGEVLESAKDILDEGYNAVFDNLPDWANPRAVGVDPTTGQTTAVFGDPVQGTAVLGGQVGTVGGGTYAGVTTTGNAALDAVLAAVKDGVGSEDLGTIIGAATGIPGVLVDAAIDTANVVKEGVKRTTLDEEGNGTKVFVDDSGAGPTDLDEDPVVTDDKKEEDPVVTDDKKEEEVEPEPEPPLPPEEVEPEPEPPLPPEEVEPEPEPPLPPEEVEPEPEPPLPPEEVEPEPEPPLPPEEVEPEPEPPLPPEEVEPEPEPPLPPEEVEPEPPPPPEEVEPEPPPPPEEVKPEPPLPPEEVEPEPEPPLPPEEVKPEPPPPPEEVKPEPPPPPEEVKPEPPPPPEEVEPPPPPEEVEPEPPPPPEEVEPPPPPEEVPEIPTGGQGFGVGQTRPGEKVGALDFYDIGGTSIFQQLEDGEEDGEEDPFFYLYPNLGGSGIVQDYDIEELIRFLNK